MKRGRPYLGERRGVVEHASLYMDVHLAAAIRTYQSLYQIFNKSEAIRQLVIKGLEATDVPTDAIVSPGTVLKDAKEEASELLGDMKPIFQNLVGNRYPLPGHVPEVGLVACPVCDAEPPKIYDDAITWRCSECMWAGTIENPEHGGFYAQVTRKQKPKVA